jgi:MFS family permease
MNLRENIKRFFPEHMNQQMREFFVSSAIFDFGTAIAAIFEPIYLWSVGWRLPSIIVFYMAAYAFYFLIAPLGASFARMRGYEHSIALSTPFLVLYYLALFNIPRGAVFAVVAVASFGLFRMFYWPGARSIMANYSTDDESGRTLSGLTALSVGAAILGPVVGGIVIQQFGFAVLFMIVSAIVLLSNVPMLMTPEKFQPHELKYVDAYKRMLRPEFRKSVVAHFGYGEEFISDFILPIFFLTFVSSYVAVGAVATVGGAVAIVAIIIVGRLTDKHRRHPIMHAGVLLTSLSWMARVISMSPLGIVVCQSFYRVSRFTSQVPFMTIANSKARDYSVMKSSLLYEMSLVVGKVMTAAAALVILFVFPDNWAAIFLLAAAITLFYGIF